MRYNYKLQRGRWTEPRLARAVTHILSQSVRHIFLVPAGRLSLSRADTLLSTLGGGEPEKHRETAGLEGCRRLRTSVVRGPRVWVAIAPISRVNACCLSPCLSPPTTPQVHHLCGRCHHPSGRCHNPSARYHLSSIPSLIDTIPHRHRPFSSFCLPHPGPP